MSTIIRGIKSVFRSKGRSAAVMVMLTICFMLGILMINVNVFANKKVASIKEDLGTKLNLEIKREYIDEFVNSKKGAGQYSEDLFLFEEAAAERISKSQHIVNYQGIIDGSFYSEALISSMELMMEELESSSNVSIDFALGSGIDGEEELDPLKRLLLRGVSNAKDLDGFTDKRFELVSGDYFYEYDIEKDVCLVESNFAEANNLDIGSTIVVNGESLKIKGIYKIEVVDNNLSGMIMIEEEFIYAPLQTVQKLLGKEGVLSGATFNVDSYDNTDKVVALSEEMLKNYGYGDKLRVYGDTSKFDKSVSSLESVKNISKIGMFSAFGAGLIIIFSSMFVSVRGRTREIGTLKAIGSSSLTVIKQFLVESLTICLIALFLGLILISFTNNYIVNNFILTKAKESEIQQEEINTIPGGENAEMFIMDGESAGENTGEIGEALSRWDMGMDFKTILYSSVFSIIICLFGTAIPAISIARLRPAQVIRSE